jgi:hypothetical protein
MSNSVEHGDKVVVVIEDQRLGPSSPQGSVRVRWTSSQTLRIRECFPRGLAVTSRLHWRRLRFGCCLTLNSLRLAIRWLQHSRFLSEADRQEAQRYKRDAGASFTDWRHRSSEELKALVLAAFHTLVVRDGMHPQAVHQAFLAIDEYREVISPDIGGADGGANAKELRPR